MKTLLVGITVFGTSGCATLLPTPPLPPVKVEAADMEVASRFMNSLFRPNMTQAQIIVEADASLSPQISLAEQNRDLRTRLSKLRRAPDTIRLVLSGDRPPPWGSDHFNYEYDRTTGTLREVGEHQISRESPDDEIWIDIGHSLRGDTFISVTCDWIHDPKSDFFELRKNETAFRFTAAIEPVD